MPQRTERPCVMVFTRDLRLRDNPALAVAAVGPVVPLFVLDPTLTGQAAPARLAALTAALDELDLGLRHLGGGLTVRTGDWAQQILSVAAQVGACAIHLAADVSRYAGTRLAKLIGLASAQRIEVITHPGTTVVPPGVLRPGGRSAAGRAGGRADGGAGWPAGDTAGAAYQVFGAYHRAWCALPWRLPVPAPKKITLPSGYRPDATALDRLPNRGAGTGAGEGGTTGTPGGCRAADARLAAWVPGHLADYPQLHDDLALDATSRISADLHLGCLSPLEIATRLRDRPGGEPFVRQLCWRDFFAQILAARPEVATVDYRERGYRWRTDPAAFEAWQAGRTGYPLVDAGMRELASTGFMHNRARMVVASFLTKDLYLDWRLGAAHFMSVLVDGDVANNQLNWQWTAGTGTDTNPHRIFNPTTQARRFDPSGAYIRRWVVELADLPAPAVHDPDPTTRRLRGYPAPVVDHAAAIAEFRASIAAGR